MQLAGNAELCDEKKLSIKPTRTNQDEYSGKLGYSSVCHRCGLSGFRWRGL